MRTKIFFIALFLYSTQVSGQTDSTFTKPDTTLAGKYFTKAKTLYKKAQYDSSKYYLEKASVIYEKAATQYEEIKMMEKYVSCINNIGNNLRRQGKYEKAMEYINKALNIAINKFGEDHIETANIYNNIGTVYYRKGNYDSAFEYYNKALKIRIKTLGRNHLKVSSSYNNIGIIYAQKNDYDKALKYYKKSLTIKIEFLGEDNTTVADTYHNIGVVYGLKGDYDKALEWYNKSLIIRLKLLGDNHPSVALSYNCVGVIYYKKGYFDKAFEFYKKSLAIYSQTLGENHPRLADSYNNIGIIYFKKGDIDHALEYYNKSLAIKLNSLGEFHPYVANTHNNIGNIYFDKGDFDKALEYYNKCLVIRLKSLGDNDPAFVYNYYNIGRAYFKKNAFDRALEYYNKSIACGLRALGENHPKVAENYNYIGAVYSKKGDYDKAFEYHNKSLKILQLNENHIKAAETYQSIGQSYFEQNKFDKALFYCQKAIISLVPDYSDSNIYSNPSFKNIRSESLLLLVLELKADVLLKLCSLESYAIKDLKMSCKTYQLAAELTDKIRGSYKAEGSKLFLGEKVSKIFEKAIETALKLYEVTQNIEYKEKAFLFAEKAKSSVLLASLQDLKAKQFAEISDSLLEQERKLRIDLTFYDTRIQKELQMKKNRDSLKLKEFEAKHFALNTRYEKLLEQLETTYPQYYKLKYQTQSASIPELQQILDSQSIIIEYFAGDSSVFIFTVSKDDFEVTTLTKDSTFNTLAESLNRSIKKVDRQTFSQSSSQMYNWLIKPVEDKITSKEKLIIIPDGILYTIPFEALIMKQLDHTEKIDFTKLDYLVNRFEVSYHNSATLYLNSLTKKEAAFAKSGQLSQGLIGFAPVFNDEANNGYILASNLNAIDLTSAGTDVRSISLDGKRFNELKYSERELNEIVKMFKKNKRDAIGYFHTDASEENFKASVGKYKYVHIATHGIINEEKPQLSGIIFSQPTNPGYTEDGVFYSGEIYNLDLNANLVVLSSCESGLGKLIRGEGLIALTRGFLYSGASNIVVSLWKVSDKHTSQLMVEFYKNILTGNSYAQSLRAAKRKLIGNASTAFPRSWSSFVLIGR